MYKLNVYFYVLLRFVLHLWNVSSIDFLMSMFWREGINKRTEASFGHLVASRHQSNNKEKELPHLGLGLEPG